MVCIIELSSSDMMSIWELQFLYVCFVFTSWFFPKKYDFFQNPSGIIIFFIVMNLLISDIEAQGRPLGCIFALKGKHQTMEHSYSQTFRGSPAIRLVRDFAEISPKDIEKLYRDALWWQREWDRTFISPMVKGSFLFAGAFWEGRQVGMGRVISDGVSDAYIQDVVVLKAFRGRGIGGKLVSFLLGELRRRGIDWIGLVGEPGTEGFYKKLGFEALSGYVPMRAL